MLDYAAGRYFNSIDFANAKQESDPAAYLAASARQSGRSFRTPGQPVVETKDGKVLIFKLGDKPSECKPTVKVGVLSFAKAALAKQNDSK